MIYVSEDDRLFADTWDELRLAAKRLNVQKRCFRQGWKGLPYYRMSAGMGYNAERSGAVRAGLEKVLEVTEKWASVRGDVC